MRKHVITASPVLVLACSLLLTAKKPDLPVQPAGPSVLWRDPTDIATRDLYYGPGGKSHAPAGGAFRFIEEDMHATSPKFEVVAPDGTKWKAKLGHEARPETVASRFLWAVGYFANENYFVPVLHVDGMVHLHRGGSYVKRDGTVYDVRLKRHLENEKKLGEWSWEKGPFSGTREWYGLRVLMAVMNSWDLKDVNNSIYQVEGPQPEQRYVVSDLGASFGTAGLNPGAKGNVEEYRRSKWFKSASAGFVDFNVPAPPSVGWVFAPNEMTRRLGLVWLGRHIPVSDAKWMGSLLARLSPEQIRDAFRAGGYSSSDVEEFARVMEGRIRELNSL